MLRGNYLEDFLYFFFGMQLGIHLCEAINMYTNILVRDVKSSPERRRIDC
jgi:hypothetical protein